MVLLGFLTVGIKLIFRVLQRPLFNPAAAGIWLTNSLVNLPVSWWGVSFDPRLATTQTSLAVALSLPLGIYLARKYRKLVILYTCLPAFVLLNYFFSASWPITALVEGTLIFYFTIMVSEPKTSPVKPRLQWFYGIMIGVLLAVSLTHGYFSLPFITPLLITNLVFSLILPLSILKNNGRVNYWQNLNLNPRKHLNRLTEVRLR
jgi:hypothetical protein